MGGAPWSNIPDSNIPFKEQQADSASVQMKFFFWLRLFVLGPTLVFPNDCCTIRVCVCVRQTNRRWKSF